HDTATRSGRLLQRLQLLAGLETYGLAGRDRDFRAGARIASDPRFARFHVEDSEATQFDAVARFERFLHGFEDRLDCHFGFGLGDAGAIHDFVDDVQLDQNSLLVQARNALHSRISQPHDKIEFIPMSSERYGRPRAAVTSEEFRRACGRFATGITIASAVDAKGVPHGLTVSSFTSVSLD